MDVCCFLLPILSNPKEFFIVSTKDMSIVRNLSEVEKIELVCEITYNIYRASSLFPMVSYGKGDILATGNPSKERYTGKVKCEVMEHRCFTFQKEISKLQENAKLVNSLQKKAENYGCPSAHVSRLTELEPSISNT